MAYGIHLHRWQKNVLMNRYVARPLSTQCDNDRLQGWLRPVAKECLTELICQKANKYTLPWWWVTESILTSGKRTSYWVEVSQDQQTPTATLTSYMVDFDTLQKNVLLSQYGRRPIKTPRNNDGLQGRFWPVARECVTESKCHKINKYPLRQWQVTWLISTGSKRLSYWVHMSEGQ